MFKLLITTFISKSGTQHSSSSLETRVIEFDTEKQADKAFDNLCRSRNTEYFSRLIERLY
jgi:hypothetical protein